jgi:predicted nuclease with RNAse H fold
MPILPAWIARSAKTMDLMFPNSWAILAHNVLWLMSQAMTFIGIDLAGSPARPTGVCLMRRGRITTSVVFGNDELLDFISRVPPKYVGVDAPLFLPAGRCCVRNDCTCPRDIHFRECDLELRRRGIRFFPITLGPMRLLTMRGIELSGILRAMGHTVLETYPGAAQDLWRIPRQKNLAGLKRGLQRFVKIRAREITCHELDAITCALVARLHYQGKAELIGRPDEGWMVIPARSK